MRRSPLALLSLVCLSTIAACASSDDGENSEAAATAGGLKGRFADLRKIKTENLAQLAVNLGADQLNRALSIRTKYVEFGVDVGDTLVYGEKAEDNGIIPKTGKVQSLSDVKKGLASQLGEKELPNELANLRLQHLAEGEDNFYVETSFGLKGGLKAGWSHPSGGFGPTGTVSVGIGLRANAEVEVKLLTATPSRKLKDLIELNGEAIKEFRSAVKGGFVIPESKEEMLAMKPGEMVSLRGFGTYGANFGVGVPILVASAGPLTYTVAVSAGVSHAVDGDLDISMVRLGGDEVAVDVGVSNGKINTATVGVFGGFGINHLCTFGGKGDAPCLDAGLGKIVEKGLLKQLGGFLQTSVSASTSKSDRRVELARARFHLNQPEVEEALKQALHGDLRYAQALYARNLESANPPVKFDFDMMRAVTTTTRSFNAEILGIDLFRKSSSQTTGAVAVQSPEGVQNVLWENITKAHGKLEKDSTFGFTTLSSASAKASDPDKASNEANLIVRAEVKDKRMDDDLVIDNIDAVIMMLAGKDALKPLDDTAAAMQQGLAAAFTSGACSGLSNANCNEKVLTENLKIVTMGGGSFSLSEARDAGVASFNGQASLAKLPQDYEGLVTKAAKLRMDLATLKISVQGGLSNPPVSVGVNLRLDDKALATLATLDAKKYEDALRAYLRTVSAKREGISIADAFTDKEIDKAVAAMLPIVAEYGQRQTMLARLESNDLPAALTDEKGKVLPFIKLPISIRADVSDGADANGEERVAKLLDEEKRIRVESVSYTRAVVGRELFEKLAAAAKKSVSFGNLDARLFEEQAATYPLIVAFQPQNLEVGFDFTVNTKSELFKDRSRFAAAGLTPMAASAKGAGVNPIRGQIFDIDQMMAFVTRTE